MGIYFFALSHSGILLKLSLMSKIQSQISETTIFSLFFSSQTSENSKGGTFESIASVRKSFMNPASPDATDVFPETAR